MTTRLTTGEQAPDFTLPAHDGSTFTLSAPREASTIVYFYPAAMTPGCTTQACDFRDNYARFTAAGFTVVGISPDPVAKLERFAARDGVPYLFLSDEDHSVHEAYATWGEKKMYGKTSIGVIRSTFVVSPEQKLLYAAYNVRAKGHVDRVLEKLDVPAV